MPPLGNAFSAPSSSPSSPCDSPVTEKSKDDNSFRIVAGSGAKRKLTRQRKLRHVSDAEVGLRLHNEVSYVLPVSLGARLGKTANLAHWSTSAQPKPLPLPETYSSLKRNDGFGFPKDALSRGEGDGRNGIGEVYWFSCATGSHTVNQTIKKFTDQTATKPTKTSTYRHRVFPQDLNVGSVHHNFQFNNPASSAPASSSSSPTLSPRRFRTVDLLHSFPVVPQEFQASSDFRTSVSDRFVGSSSHLSPSRITHSHDHHPVRSPTEGSPHKHARSDMGAFYSHHKSLPEDSTAWHEGKTPANMHPLPRPPGVKKPTFSIVERQFVKKPDESLMKSQWQKGKLIGRGTYGSVYLATNRLNGASCAMKEVDLIPDDPKSAECIQQLEQEIKVLQHLKHPNIVQYYGCEVVDDRFCIYLEHIYPGSLSKFVQENCGAVTESVVRNFTRHILSGLAFLHSSKIIHRDVKGANLLVDASGVVKIADFGLAKHLTGHVTALSLKGSPHWMAPEVLQVVMRNDSNRELAFAVDIWSLGCTVIEMLNGKPPWSECNGVQAMFHVLHKSPSIPETLSSEGKDFLKLCFQRNPVDRPSASVLLGHPFLQNSSRQNVPVTIQEFSGLKLIDKSVTPRDWTAHVKDLISTAPYTPVRAGKMPCNCELCAPSFAETSDTASSSRHIPHCSLEVFPSVSLPWFNSSPRNISPPNVSNHLPHGAGSSHPNIFRRPREISYR